MDATATAPAAQHLRALAQANRVRLAEGIGLGPERLVWMEQVHGRTVSLLLGFQTFHPFKWRPTYLRIAKVYEKLAEIGGEKLVGPAKTMAPGTFWSALKQGS